MPCARIWASLQCYSWVRLSLRYPIPVQSGIKPALPECHGIQYISLFLMLRSCRWRACGVEMTGGAARLVGARACRLPYSS